MPQIVTDSNNNDYNMSNYVILSVKTGRCGQSSTKWTFDAQHRSWRRKTFPRNGLRLIPETTLRPDDDPAAFDFQPTGRK